MHPLPFGAAAFLCVWPLTSYSHALPPGSVELVRELYRQYGREATDQPSINRQSLFVEESREKLLEFLEPGLTELLRKDRECVARTREVCKLGFSPLWASNDPAAKNLQVLKVPAGRVRVQFTYPSNGQRIVLHFRVVPTPSGPRIADIEYERGHTLRKTLGASP